MLIPFGVFSAAGASGGGGGGAAYELISSAYGDGSSGVITFSSIPQDYKHLQIRGTVRTLISNLNSKLSMTVNNNSGSIYNNHSLQGNGSSVTSVYNTGITSQLDVSYATGNSATANIFSPVIIDILDYTNTSKNKTTRSFGRGYDSANDYISFMSGLAQTTSAVSSIELKVYSGHEFRTGTRFSLYGIKG